MAIRVVAGLLFLVVISFLGTRIYELAGERNEKRSDLEALNQKLNQARLDEARLQEELQYLSDPENLEKELRARFNYREVGEKMIIIVPGTSTTSTDE